MILRNTTINTHNYICSHVAVTDFTITEQRNHAMTFSTPLDHIYHAIFIQNPAKAYNYRAYTSELSNVVWSAIVLWITLTPPILFVVARLVAFMVFMKQKYLFTL